MFLCPKELDKSRDALIDDKGNRVSYDDLMRDCELMKQRLKQRPLILVLADRKINTLRFYYVAMSNKCVLLLLNPDSDNIFVMRYIEMYKPNYVWANREVKNCFAEYSVVYETKEHVLYKTAFPKIDLYDDLALLLTTSGSTGNPKTVRLSYQNLRENADAFVDAIGIEETDKGVVNLPIYYTYGLAICHMHFYRGASLLLTEEKVYSPKFEAFIEQEQATNFHGVPYVFECFDRTGFWERIPKSVRLITMGGGRTNLELHKKINHVMQKNNIRVNALYGQTEGTTALTKVPVGACFNEPGCIGVACKGMIASIDDENQELCFQGGSVCLGYADGWKDLSKGDENKGFLRTGDTAYIDQNGRIYLTGRIKRILKLRGIRINMDDIEKEIEQEFNITCACAGTDSKMNFYIVDENYKEVVYERIIKKYKISAKMLEVIALEEMPRNSQGKINYASLF